MYNLKEMTKERTVKNKYITFLLASEEYAVDIHKVKEIIGLMEITHIPKTPGFIQGVVNLRDKVIPVIDLRLKFNMEFKKYDDRTSIIIMEIKVQDKISLIGVAVDKVSEVLQITEEELEEAPTFGVDINTCFILGMAKVKGKVKIILDIDQVLTTAELSILNNLSRTED